MIYKSMSASTSRLTFGDRTLSFLFGFKFPVYQRAMTTFIDTASARATRTGAFSEDEGRDTNLLRSKGDGVQTRLRLGSVVPRSETGGYLVLVATDHAEDPEEAQYDLALMHAKDEFWDLPDEEPLVSELPGTVDFTTSSKGSEVTNRLKWMTDLGEAGSDAHRPRLSLLGEDRYLMTYERTTHDGEYEGLFAQLIDGEGAVLLEEKKLFDDHISGSDEPVRVGEEIIFVIGDSEESALVLLAIDAELNSRRLVID